MTTFALVHGAWHGAWCWDRLIPELEAGGHRAVAMDLPVDDGSATWGDYAAAVIGALAREGEDVVVVGHSFGSMTIPLVAAARPVRGLIFLCGVLPRIGEENEHEPAFLEPDDDPYARLVSHDDGSTSWPDLAAATAAFYHDCATEDAAWAFARLRRQNSSSLWDRPYPIDRWPNVPRVSIAAEDDRAIRFEWLEWASHNRLGVDPIVIPGGHSPFLARPQALADLVTDIAAEM